MNAICQNLSIELAEYDDFEKSHIGRRDVEDMLSEDGKLDRRKFGKIACPYCQNEFNPFYAKTIIEKSEWDWRWQGCDYKEPEKDYKCNCPECKKELFFTIYVGQ